MPDTHSEIEYKFGADLVAPAEFVQWAMSRNPVRYERETVPDIYYAQGLNVVRHRWLPGGAGELTVKRRRSRSTTMNREEIDLRFGPGTQLADVTAFLQATGWKRKFTLFKEDVHMFWYELPAGGQVNVSFYAVERLNERTRKRVDRRQFIEVEVEKGSVYTPIESQAILNQWWAALRGARLRITKPMNESLWEIYSGRKYQTASLHRG